VNFSLDGAQFVKVTPDLIDGLSIPFSRLGLHVRHRTVSITNTWSVSRPGTIPPVPDWLLSTRRLGTNDRQEQSNVAENPEDLLTRSDTIASKENNQYDGSGLAARVEAVILDKPHVSFGFFATTYCLMGS
jgi:hypothetical protein